MNQQPNRKRTRTKTSTSIVFDGSSVTAATKETSAIINLNGHSVSASDVGKILAIRGGANFTIGTYMVVSVESGPNAWTLDRPCTMGGGEGMIGRTINQEGRWHDPVPEYFDADLPDNPSQGQARQQVLEALNLVQPEILKVLAAKCLSRALLQPEVVDDHDWHGPLDYLLWRHVRDAGHVVTSMGAIFGNLMPLKAALISWAKDDRQERWNLCDKEGEPLVWITEAAVQTLVHWHRRGRLPKNLSWENLDFHCYRSLDSEDAFKMFDIERHFDAGSGYIRIAPEIGAESSRLSDRAQRTAKQEYKSLGGKLGLTRMQHVSSRFFEWYALRTFLGFKLRQIRERELQTKRNDGTGLGVGNPHDPDDLSAIVHGISKVADLVGFQR